VAGAGASTVFTGGTTPEITATKQKIHFSNAAAVSPKAKKF
jgi:hypothetical protein